MRPDRRSARRPAVLGMAVALFGSSLRAEPDAGAKPAAPPPAAPSEAEPPPGTSPAAPPPPAAPPVEPAPDADDPAPENAPPPSRPGTAPDSVEPPPAAPRPVPSAPPATHHPPPPAHGPPARPGPPAPPAPPASPFPPPGPSTPGPQPSAPAAPDAAAPEPATEPGSSLALDVAAGMTAAGRFPSTDRDAEASEAVGGVLEAGLWIDLKRRLGFGLSYERADLGKARFAVTDAGEILDAAYGVDTFWLRGRWYASSERPAFYLDVAAGPALGRVRATGTESSESITLPARPFECSDYGSLGFGGRLSAGVEVDLLAQLSFTAQAGIAGHYLSGDEDAFDGCAPGIGPAINGGARVGLAYRFGL